MTEKQYKFPAIKKQNRIPIAATLTATALLGFLANIPIAGAFLGGFALAMLVEDASTKTETPGNTGSSNN